MIKHRAVVSEVIPNPSPMGASIVKAMDLKGIKYRLRVEDPTIKSLISILLEKHDTVEFEGPIIGVYHDKIHILAIQMVPVKGEKTAIPEGVITQIFKDHDAGMYVVESMDRTETVFRLLIDDPELQVLVDNLHIGQSIQ